MGSWPCPTVRGRSPIGTGSRPGCPERRHLGPVRRARPRGCSLALRLRAASALGHRRHSLRTGPSGHPGRGAGLANGSPERQRPLRRRTGQAARQAGKPAAEGMSLERGRHLNPRLRPNLLRQYVPTAQLRQPTRRPASSTTTDLAETALEFKPRIPRRRILGYPRRINFRQAARDRKTRWERADGSTWRTSPARRPQGVSPADEDPRAALSCHKHPAQVAARPRGGLVLATAEYSDAVDRAAMLLGGPLSHLMRPRPSALAEAASPRSAGYAQRVADKRQGLAEGLPQARTRGWSGVRATDNHIVLLDSTSSALTGRQAESRCLWTPASSTNRNSIPARPQLRPGVNTSGIRFWARRR